MIFEPHVYQEYAIQRLLDQPACGLFLDLGLGKTAITLTALVELLHDRFTASRVLVIAPLRVAESTWTAEAVRWDHTRYLKISKVLGTEAERLQALEREADVWIINQENVKWLVLQFGAAWPFDMVVIDELSGYKSHEAKRFQALRWVRPMIKRIVGLTATPSPNGLMDLWSQVYLLDQGERLGNTITAYRERYFTPGQDYTVWVPNPGAAEAIYAKLADLCISMRAEDWLSVPDRIDRTVHVRLPDEVQVQYKRLERELLLQFDEGVIEAGSRAVVMNKLLQLANGTVYDVDRVEHEFHSVKLDALEDLVEAANGAPVLVAYAFQHDAARIMRRFPQAVRLRGTEEIDAWNRREIPLMVAHPASAGHGLNLQQGGNQIVWYGLTWSLELYLQFIGRLHRQGQTERVIVHHLVAEGTVDETVMQVLGAKGDGQAELIEALRARIERLRGEAA